MLRKELLNRGRVPLSAYYHISRHSLRAEGQEEKRKRLSGCEAKFGIWFRGASSSRRSELFPGILFTKRYQIRNKYTEFRSVQINGRSLCKIRTLVQVSCIVSVGGFLSHTEARLRILMEQKIA